jgi:hypothetical protein
MVRLPSSAESGRHRDRLQKAQRTAVFRGPEFNLDVVPVVEGILSGSADPPLRKRRASAFLPRGPETRGDL